jgi:uncharacterized protein (DUF58 family)
MANSGHSRKRIWKAVGVCAVLLAFALIALFVGDSDYNATGIGWVPLVMAICAIVLAFAYIQVLKRGLEVTAVTELHDCRRGDDIDFVIHFRNKTPLFYFRIEAFFFVSDLFGGVASEASTTLSLAPFQRYDLHFSTKFEHVGTYSAGMNRLVVCDFLRLFTAEVGKRQAQIVHVTPRIQSLESVDLSNDSQTEAQQPRKSVFADSLDYAYVRPYVPGDPLKTIHWKLSARTDGYMTRLFEESTNPGVCVIMDFFAPEERTPFLMGMFDAVIETAISIARYAQAEGFETEIRYANREDERICRETFTDSELDEMVADMPSISNAADRSEAGVDLLSEQLRHRYGKNNLVMCTGNLSSRLIETAIEARMRRRNPIIFAVAPSDLEGRELDEWCEPLARLDAANVGYKVIKSSDDLVGGDL